MGGGARSICHKKISDNGCLALFLVVLHFFYRMPMVYFKENYNFRRFQMGFNIFFQGGGGGGGGVQLFLGDPIAYSL